MWRFLRLRWIETHRRVYQEQEDRRESNNASGYTPQVPPELEAAARKKASEREALRLVQPAFKPYYKQSVQKYLQIYSR